MEVDPILDLTDGHRADLRNVVMHYPLDPGETISHKTMGDLGRLGYAVRQSNGFWIPTAKGLEAYARLVAREGS